MLRLTRAIQHTIDKDDRLNYYQREYLKYSIFCLIHVGDGCVVKELFSDVEKVGDEIGEPVYTYGGFNDDTNT